MIIIIIIIIMIIIIIIIIIIRARLVSRNSFSQHAWLTSRFAQHAAPGPPLMASPGVFPGICVWGGVPYLQRGVEKKISEKIEIFFQLKKKLKINFWKKTVNVQCFIFLYTLYIHILLSSRTGVRCLAHVKNENTGQKYGFH